MKGTVLLLSFHFPSSFLLQANNMVIHTACRHFHNSQRETGDSQGIPHIVTSSVEHDSIRLPLEQLVKEGLAGKWHSHRGGLNGGLVSAGVLRGGQDPACSVMFHFLPLEKGTISPCGCSCCPRLDVSPPCSVPTLPTHSCLAQWGTCSPERSQATQPASGLVSWPAEATFVPVSPRSGQAEVDDVLAAIQPNTCLVSLMLANNETGVIMVSVGREGHGAEIPHKEEVTEGSRRDVAPCPCHQPVAELSQRVCALNRRRAAQGLPRILVHTDAAQMIGKGRVDVQELGVDYLTIVGHKVWPCSCGPAADHAV